MSMESSKNDGSGTGCRVIPLFWVFFVSSVVVPARCATSIASWLSWSGWGVIVGWFSVVVSFGALLPGLFFLFFLISAAVAAGPLEAATLAMVVVLVETSLLVGVEVILIW